MSNNPHWLAWIVIILIILTAFLLGYALGGTV